MNTLPLELLRCICDKFKDKKNTLKAVRLVNKRLASAAAPLLFRTLLVYQTPESWEKLGSVARCEWLAQHVVKLEIAALEYLPHYLDFVDWKQCTWYTRWRDCRDQNNRAAMVSLLLEKLGTKAPRTSCQSHPCIHYRDWKQYPEVRKQINQSDKGIAARLSSGYRDKNESPISELESALGVRYRYERYCYWHDGENKLSDLLPYSKDLYPFSDLVSFPKLQTVAVLGSDELWKDSTWPSAGADRKARETTVPSSPCTRLEQQNVQRNVHLDLTLQMLQASGVNITRLELHRYREVLRDMHFPVIQPLKKLQELVLDFPFCVNYGETFDSLGRWELTSWLQDADDLRTIIINSQDPKEHDCLWFFDVIALFHGTHWPKLQRIQFKETFVRPKSLLRFLSEHTQSLESIRIEKPVMSKEAWESVASEFHALQFRSPDCVVEMEISDLSHGTHSLEGLEDDSNWNDR